MEITLEAYFENNLYKLYAGGGSASGISCEGKTPEECAENFKPYVKDYLDNAKREYLIGNLEDKVRQNGGNINLSGKDVILFDGDTEEQAGESFEVLGIETNEDNTMYVRIDIDGDDAWDIWDIYDLSTYELELLLNSID